MEIHPGTLAREHSLPRSFWINGILIPVLINTTLIILGIMWLMHSQGCWLEIQPPDLDQILSSLILTADIWAVVGLFRCGMKRPKTTAQKIKGGALAGVVSLILFWSTVHFYAFASLAAIDTMGGTGSTSWCQ